MSQKLTDSDQREIIELAQTPGVSVEHIHARLHRTRPGISLETIQDVIDQAL